jgi:hypothetical protein
MSGAAASLSRLCRIFARATRDERLVFVVDLYEPIEIVRS